MRKLKMTAIIGFLAAVLGVVCAIICAIYDFDTVALVSIVFAGIGAWVAVGAKFVYSRRERLGQY